MDTDILKPDTGALMIARPTPSASHSRFGSHNNSGDTSAGAHTPTTPDERNSSDGGHSGRYVEPVSEGEDDEDRDLVAARNEDKIAGLEGHEEQVREAIAWRTKMLGAIKGSNGDKSGGKKKDCGKGLVKRDFAAEESDGEASADERTPFLRGKAHKAHAQAPPPPKTPAMSIDPLAPSSAFDETLRDRLQRETQAQAMGRTSSDETDETTETYRPIPPRPAGAPGGDDRVLERNWRAPEGKKIAVPVRIGE